MLTQTWDKVRLGDSLYVDSLATVSDTFALGYHWLIRPINAADIDKMKFPKWQKQKMINTLDTTNHKVGLIFSNYVTSSDKMYKAETGYIGTYINRDGTYRCFSDEVKGANDYHWYIINSNKNVLDDNYVVKMPQGYTYADSNYYFDAESTILEEAPAFNKTNKKASLMLFYSETMPICTNSICNK